MNLPLGTTGYAEVIDRFIRATDAIDFDRLHAPFLPLIPTQPACVLDVGAGCGRDAAAFAHMNHQVVAVEPLPPFLAAARQRHDSPRITWLADALPSLTRLGDSPRFDFVLTSGVWHHLDAAEQRQAMARIAALMRPGAVFALSLRHGPAGAGTHVFPTDGLETIRGARACGLVTVLHLPDQPSLMAGKAGVTWTRVAFEKR